MVLVSPVKINNDISLSHNFTLQFGALYRGLSSPLIGVSIINAVGFGVYGNVLRRLDNPSSIQSVAIAGMTSGLTQVIPYWLLFFGSHMNAIS